MPETYENSIGDNSAGAIDADALKQYIERAANIMKEQKDLSEDLKEICAEASEAGVATSKDLRRRARESLMDPEVLYAQLETARAQREALGWFNDLPKGSEPTFDDLIESAKPKRRGRPRRNGGFENQRNI